MQRAAYCTVFWLKGLRSNGLGLRGQGLRVFRDEGFRGLGFRGLGFGVLGFWVDFDTFPTWRGPKYPGFHKNP